MKNKLSSCCVHIYRNPNMFTYVLNLGSICKEDSGKTYLCGNCHDNFDLIESFPDPDDVITICESCVKKRFINIIKKIKHERRKKSKRRTKN